MNYIEHRFINISHPSSTLTITPSSYHNRLEKLLKKVKNNLGVSSLFRVAKTAGDVITYFFDKNTDITEIRLVFDSDLNRKYRNMPCNYPLEEKVIKLPETLIKEYRIEGVQGKGKVVTLEVSNNHQRFVRHAVKWCVKEIRFVPVSTHGFRQFRLFGFEIS